MSAKFRIQAVSGRSLSPDAKKEPQELPSAPIFVLIRLAYPIPQIHPGMVWVICQAYDPHLHIYKHTYACIDGWMDGWIDG